MISYLVALTMKFPVICPSDDTCIQKLRTSFLHVNQIIILNTYFKLLHDLKASLWKEMIV